MKILFLIVIIGIVFISLLIYFAYKISVYNAKDNNLPSFKIWDMFFSFSIYLICITALLFSKDLVSGGIPLEKLDYSKELFLEYYAPLAPKHFLTVIVFFALGVFAYALIKTEINNLPPIPYATCCSLLIINIVFTIMLILHTNSIAIHGKPLETPETVILLRVGFSLLSIMYLITLIKSMNIMRKREKDLNKEYNNKLFNKLYIFFIKYNTLPILWIIMLFPVLIIIQLVLVLFGQQPDSFIKVFLDTSSYKYSQLSIPDPIVTGNDGHYLCTVSVRGHKKIVKPLRSGIRGGKRIVVNRQLLVANAFENILDQYTPTFHKGIRYIYDKYGYPLSKYINTTYAADFTYFIMKPLEWLFLITLYCIDKNPENRIHIQYSELRK